MHIRSFFLTSAALACAAIAVPATAQTVDQDRPFDGPYIGASFGFDAQPNDVGESITFDRNLDGSFGDTIVNAAGAGSFTPGFCNGQARTGNRADGCVNDRDSYSYYARVGFDKQYGPIVVGVVGEFGNSEIRDSVSAFSTTPASYTINRDILYTGNARLRAGYALNNSLFYATGGGVYARVNNYFRTTNVTNTFTTNGDSNAYGFTVGGGMEQKIGRKFSIGLEYLFNRLQDDDYRVRVTGGAANNPFILGGAGGTDFARSYQKFRWHSVRAVALFRF